MISEDSLHIDWITKVSAANRKADKILVEKVIRALLLLEGLANQNLDFVLKGGTALMLILDSSKRLSIDIDIIIEKEPKDLQKIFNDLLKPQGLQGLNFRKEKLQPISKKLIISSFINLFIKRKPKRKASYWIYFLKKWGTRKLKIYQLNQNSLFQMTIQSRLKFHQKKIYSETN